MGCHTLPQSKPIIIENFTLTNGFGILCSKKVDWNIGECPALDTYTHTRMIYRSHRRIVLTNWMNGNPTTLEIHTLPPSTPIIIGNFTLTNGFGILCSKKMDWNTGECLAFDHPNPLICSQVLFAHNNSKYRVP
ncbi:hypothetical protein AVEN_155414-1 [Araneus ventricosus]|uniref:Uncharacterized protein n=1 Tax=Araneus ventricosus TaxID=182803 RepID=A0A4Y2WQ31_ARAVE|nr:hypothetical protein AVEN_137918-1 [Araneus ventricosus]GBO38550.1 hypothetical protein AVEN_155414-1 [Araneus ventricosus]